MCTVHPDLHAAYRSDIGIGLSKYAQRLTFYVKNSFREKIWRFTVWSSPVFSYFSEKFCCILPFFVVVSYSSVKYHDEMRMASKTSYKSFYDLVCVHVSESGVSHSLIFQ